MSCGCRCVPIGLRAIWGRRSLRRRAGATPWRTSEEYAGRESGASSRDDTCSLPSGSPTFPPLRRPDHAGRCRPARAPSIVSLLYTLARKPLFALPPEAAHQAATGWLGAALSTRPARAASRALLDVRDPALVVRRWGIEFPGPVGLAAGFDKSGGAFNALGALGFSHVEIGTVTAEAQPGNPPPRLFRLPEDGALLNRMGFNNPGADAVARRLRGETIEPILGINLGKSKVTPL